jgi:hypothetical protein
MLSTSWKLYGSYILPLTSSMKLENYDKWKMEVTRSYFI